MKASTKIAIGVRILWSRLTRRPRPFFVQYGLLNACDARCGYCAFPARYEEQLTTDEHRSILREFARLGAIRIKFLGGEPLLRPDLGELIEQVKALGMRAALVTNGLRLPERMDIARSVDELVISIDGRRESHDAQRGRGTWQRVMRAIEACAAEQIDFFLSAVVTRRSMHDIDWLLALADRLGVMVNFQIPQFNREMFGPAAREWMPSPDEIRAIVSRIIAAKKRGAPVLFTAGSYRRTLDWKDFELERIENPGVPTPCTAGRMFLNVDANGDIIPCVLHAGTFTPKNALRDGVEVAWKHAWEHSCTGCYNTWLNENRAIFDLRPEVAINFWRNYMRPRRAYRARLADAVD